MSSVVVVVVVVVVVAVVVAAVVAVVIYPALVLRPHYIPEKVDVNKKIILP